MNGDGTEKLPLAFIGKIKKCFGRKAANEIGSYNHVNLKSCMNTRIFLSGLNHLIFILGEPEIEKNFYL